MEAIMTVTDLVRDPCKTASELVKSGTKIRVTSGKRTLFHIVPAQEAVTDLSERDYTAIVKDLDEIARKADLDANPIVKLRRERA
jgi:hypothetical protein